VGRPLISGGTTRHRGIEPLRWLFALAVPFFGAVGQGLGYGEKQRESLGGALDHVSEGLDVQIWQSYP
jgi:hypothetical protein